MGLQGVNNVSVATVGGVANKDQVLKQLKQVIKDFVSKNGKSASSVLTIASNASKPIITGPDNDPVSSDKPDHGPVKGTSSASEPIVVTGGEKMIPYVTTFSGNAETVTITLNQTNLPVSTEKTTINKEVKIDDVYYDYDKWGLRKESKKELDKLINILKEKPDVKMQISAYTDERDSVEYNKELSQKRAQSVVDYLVSKGIDKDRLIAYGYGKSQPVVKNAQTEQEHQQNRRTTYKISTESDSYIEPKEVGIPNTSTTIKAELTVNTVPQQVTFIDKNGNPIGTKDLPSQDIKISVSATANRDETGGVIFHKDTNTFDIVPNKDGKVKFISSDGKVTVEYTIDELEKSIKGAYLEARQNEQKIPEYLAAKGINASVIIDKSESTGQLSATEKIKLEDAKTALKTGATVFDEYTSLIAFGSRVDVLKPLSSSDIGTMAKNLECLEHHVIVTKDSFSAGIFKKLESFGYIDKDGKILSRGYKVLYDEKKKIRFIELFSTQALQALQNAVSSEYSKIKQSDLLGMVEGLEHGGSTYGWEAFMENYNQLNDQIRIADDYFNKIAGKNASGVSGKQIEDAIKSNKFSSLEIADLKRVKSHIEELEQKSGVKNIEISKKDFADVLLPDYVILLSDMKFNGKAITVGEVKEFIELCGQYNIKPIIVEVPHKNDYEVANAEIKQYAKNNIKFNDVYPSDTDLRNNVPLVKDGFSTLSEMREFMYLLATSANGGYIVAEEGNIFSGINAAKNYIVKTAEIEINPPSAEYDKLNLNLPGGTFTIPVVETK